MQGGRSPPCERLRARESFLREKSAAPCSPSPHLWRAPEPDPAPARRAQGKTGSTITEQADRKDKDAYKGKTKNNLFDHSDSFPLSSSETGEYYVTLNELVYKAPREDKTRTVSQHLWMGSKFNDLEVERKSERMPEKTDTRRALMTEQRNTKPSDAFKTHSNEVAESSIRIAQTMRDGGEAIRSKQILPMAEGGQRAQIGRKAKGDCARSLDASYRNIGLRR